MSRALLLSSFIVAVTACNSDSGVSKLVDNDPGVETDQDTGDTPAPTDTGTSAPPETGAPPENGPPEVSVLLRPAEAFTDTVLTAESAASDPDGDELTLIYAFSVDGMVVQEGEATTLDGATHFSKGQSVTVMASASDGIDTSSASSEPVVIRNTPPTAPALAMNGSEAGGCEEGWTETPDGTACAAAYFEEMDWFTAGDHCEELGAELMSSTSGADDAFIQDMIAPDTYLWIGLNDLDSEGAWVWTDATPFEYTGWDTASQPDSGATLPGTPDEDCVLMTMSGWHDFVCESEAAYNGHICAKSVVSGLQCTIDTPSDDVDDDAIDYTFSWAVDGVPYEGSTTTTIHEGDTIPSDALGGMAEWTCTVTPNDGEEDGPTATISQTVGDEDGDGVADEEDCAPELADVPRLVLWESIETLAMDSDPPAEGSTWCDGAWGGQGVREAYERTTWVQESDWNSLWVPDSIDDEVDTYAVDVDLYLPSGNRSGEFGINRTLGSSSHPGACNHSSGGLVLGYSQGRCGGAGPCLSVGGVGGPYYSTDARDDVFDRWVNMRFEVFRSDGLVQLWIDDELETCFFADDAALYGPKVKFNANTSCCSESPSFGISNLNFSLGE